MHRLLSRLAVARLNASAPKNNVASSARFLSAAAAPKAQDIGIVGMDVYVPQQYVEQSELEQYDGIPAGKYTIGLGQQQMAFVNDREDIYSMCLTVVSKLMKKYNIQPKDVGRLEVATETILDHSKSIKTVLMQMFEQHGNTDIEGIDTYNACYGGTAALFNSVAWMDSGAWDGRYAIFVAADIAEYAKGNARPTGGCGATAFLIGPKAPLVLDQRVRASHMEHAWDFYKPNLSSPYPMVDGKYSNICYLRALDNCYARYLDKHRAVYGKDFSLADVNHVLFHAPYNKLVQKSFARLVYNDMVRHPAKADPSVAELIKLKPEDTYENRDVEKAFTALSSSDYKTKVLPSTVLPKHIGNTYSASLYMGLASLVNERAAQLAGNELLLFSYGSGLAASLFKFHVQSSADAKRALDQMKSNMNLAANLTARQKKSPEVLEATLLAREKLYAGELHEEGEHSYTPSSPVDDGSLVAGTFYLTHKDKLYRRFYKQL